MSSTYVPAPHRDHSRFAENWDEMVSWWNGMTEKYHRDFVREVAVKSLDKDFEGSGQGISSSDVSHRAFSIWQTMMDEREHHSSDLAFLVDYNYNLG